MPIGKPVVKPVTVPVTVIACALVAALGFGACAVQAQTTSQATIPSKSQRITTTTKMSTPGYVPRAQIAEQFEIEAGKIAVQRGQKTEVRQFGQMMVADHGKASAAFTRAMEKAKLKPSVTGLDTDHLNMLEHLRTASIAAFDRTYVTMQIQAHEKALSLHQGYAQGGDKAALKAAANDMVPLIQKHLQELRSISAQLAGES